MKKAIKISAIVVVSLLILVTALAMVNGITPLSLGLHSPVYQSSGLALDGYDVVSYFQGAPVKGDSRFAYEWKEVTWNFTSQANLDTFKATPEKFIPQYGGYCAKAISAGFAAPANPTVWTVKDDKLYIFTDEEVKAEFLQHPNEMIEACNKAWE